jgi:hypothetical protein
VAPLEHGHALAASHQVPGKGEAPESATHDHDVERLRLVHAKDDVPIGARGAAVSFGAPDREVC